MSRLGTGESVWDAFLARVKWSVVSCYLEMNQGQHQRILNDEIMPYTRVTLQANFVGKGDNVPIQRGSRELSFLDENEVYNLPWPVSLSDMV